MNGAFLAIDWGTTNRRIYRIEDGRVVSTERDGVGARAVAPADYPREIAGIRARFDNLPILLAGMVGSTVGWRAVPYVPLPAGLRALADGIDWVDERTGIIPGIASMAPADVMRGEEVQLLGAAATGLVPDDALLCQPGTHCKWVHVEHGEITAFETTMTGELFALLRDHSILAPQLAGTVTSDAAFEKGVREGATRDLGSALFEIRARAVLQDEMDAASFASGLLIGSDVARHVARDNIYVLADPVLGGLYVSAIEALGGRAALIDSHDAFLAGIQWIWEHIR